MKYFYIVLVFLFINTSLFSQEIDDKIENALNDTSITIRGKISKENEMYSLFYFDVYEKDSHAKFLQEKGFHGGGPSWLGIIYVAFNIFEPNIIDTMEFNPQESGITFKSINKEDLEMVGRVISLIKSDEAIMLEMIERAKQLEIMK